MHPARLTVITRGIKSSVVPETILGAVLSSFHLPCLKIIVPRVSRYAFQFHDVYRTDSELSGWCEYKG